ARRGQHRRVRRRVARARRQRERRPSRAGQGRGAPSAHAAAPRRLSDEFGARRRSGRHRTTTAGAAMRRLIYTMGTSLDGFTAGPDGDFGWSAPGEELHRFFNEQARETSLELYGRGMYETMRFWQTADVPGASDVTREFARIWQATPKLVFSRTLTEVGGNATLASGDVVAEVERLKAGDG